MTTTLAAPPAQLCARCADPLDPPRPTWTLRFPAPAPMISINQTPSWRKTSPAKKKFREAVYWAAKAAKLPHGLAKVRIDVELRFPRGGRRDAPNYHPYVLKPLVDGLGPATAIKRGGQEIVNLGYGLIADDTAEHLDGPFPSLGAPLPKEQRATMPYGEVIITITDLSGQVGA